MPDQFETGSRVKWQWGQGWGHGTVSDVFEETVTKTINGTEVTRHASEEDPAYLIVQDDRKQVLKSQTEIYAENED